MKDKIVESMRKKDCILGIVPDHGGMWLSSLRTDTPRNFKKTGDRSWTWTGFSAASNVIGSDDFEFEVIYRLNVLQNPNYIFYHSDTRGSVNVGFTGSGDVYLTMGRVRNPETGTRKNAGALQSDFAEFSAIGEWVSVVIRRVSGVLSLILNGRTTNTTTIDKTYLWYSDFDPISNFDGNMRSAKLVNLTTGETVWSASRAELYEKQNPWPSDVPRNFAEDGKSFYDYQAILSEQLDPTHDYSFFMDTEIVSDKSDCPMFYIGGADGVFGLYCYSNNTIRFTTNLLRSATNPNDKYANMIVYKGDARPAGRHSFEGRIEGNIIKTFFDNQLAFTSAVAVRTNTKTVGCNRCSSGYVYNIRIVDLTENRVIWSYPSEAERVQLLTKTNVRTDRGVFEAADTSKRWSVTTQLRAASLLPECTIIVDADNPNGERTTFVSCAQRANPEQGFFVIRKQDAGSVMFGYSGKNSSGAMVYPARYIISPDGKHVFAFVLDYSVLRLRIYIDGVEVDNRAMDVHVVAPPGFDETANPVIIGATSTSDGFNLTSKISHCLIFDRALTASEIAALS